MNNRDELQNLKEEFGNLLSNLKSTFGESGEKISKSSKELLDHSVDKFKDQMEKALQKGKNSKRDVEDFVREHPWQAAGAALATGLILGLLLRGRK